jgi:hypothetical protein
MLSLTSMYSNSFCYSVSLLVMAGSHFEFNRFENAEDMIYYYLTLYYA